MAVLVVDDPIREAGVFSPPASGHDRSSTSPSGRVQSMSYDPEACKAIWLASEPIRASATTVTSLRRWTDSNAQVTGDIAAVWASLPSHASTIAIAASSRQTIRVHVDGSVPK